MKVYFLAAILVLFACKPSHKNKEVEAVSLAYKVHTLPIVRSQLHTVIFKPVEGKNETYILHRKQTDTLYVYSFDSCKIIKKYALPDEIYSIDDYVVHNDTIYMLTPYGIGLQQLTSPESLKQFRLNHKFWGTGNYITYDKDGLHVNIMSKLYLDNAADLKVFFGNKVDALVSLEGDSVVLKNIAVNYPESYSDVLDIDLTYVSKNVMPNYAMYSFAQSQELYLVSHDNKQTTCWLGSNYFVQSPKFDTATLYDLAYREKVQKSTFDCVIYNPFRKEIYRSNYHANNGVVDKRPFIYKFSLIVADDQPKVKYEMVFEGGKYLFHRVIPTRKGVALQVVPEDIEEKCQLIFHEYTLE